MYNQHASVELHANTVTARVVCNKTVKLTLKSSANRNLQRMHYSPYSLIAISAILEIASVLQDHCASPGHFYLARKNQRREDLVFS